MTPEIRRILYATDLSPNSFHAFLYAIDMARSHDAKIIALHVVEPIPEAVRFVGVLKRVEEKERKEKVQQIQEYIQELCKKAEAKIGPPCVVLVSKILVPRGHPPEEILKAADEEDCDVIVLGTHGKGFLAHTFLGSVSNAVLHLTRKPAFMIPLPSEK